MSVDRFELQQREYEARGAYHFSDLTSSTPEGIESRVKLELTLATIRKFNPKLVADFGCGEGVLVQSLRSRSIQCIGLDLSIQALTLTPVDIRGSVIQADIGKAPIKNASLDVVTMIAVLEHIPPPNIPSVLQEAKRITKRGGQLIIRVPSKNQPLEQKHYQHFTETSLRQVLGSNGLIVEQMIGNHDVSQNWNEYYSHMDQASDEMRYQAYQEVFAVCEPAKAKRLLTVCINI